MNKGGGDGARQRNTELGRWEGGSVREETLLYVGMFESQLSLM